MQLQAGPALLPSHIPGRGYTGSAAFPQSLSDLSEGPGFATSMRNHREQLVCAGIGGRGRKLGPEPKKPARARSSSHQGLCLRVTKSSEKWTKKTHKSLSALRRCASVNYLIYSRMHINQYQETIAAENICPTIKIHVFENAVHSGCTKDCHQFRH